MGKKRILWLYNHNTLMKSEVKLLMELGYEVYSPKIPPFDVSIAVDWSLDENLTIPQECIAVLNNVDFYTQKIPEEAMGVMNAYFDMVIMGVFIEPLKSIILNYSGTIIFHPFGLENGMSYTGIIESQAGRWLLQEIEKLGTRFWFGQSYENLSEVECTFFKERAIFLPIGLLDSEIKDTWTGEKRKLLFICPRIRTNPYYQKIYEEFKKNMGDIPHSIGGAQQLKVENDPSVLGYLPQNEYERLYPSHSVMFYHSQEARHIHYHPFEAIKCGLPLIYMAGGLLDRLGGAALPGRCKNIKQARKKCKRIISGDRKFADKVRKSQGVLLRPLSYDFCKEQWIKSLEIIERNTAINVGDRNKKLAIILPLAYKGGVLDYAIRLTIALHNAIKQMHENVSLVFGYPEDDIYSRENYFKRLREVGIGVRPFKWEIIDERRMSEIYGILGYDNSYEGGNYCLCNDRMKYFEDCDALLFASDRVPRAIFSSGIRYGVVVHDYIQRYVPNMLKEYEEWEVFSLVRRAEAVFTTGIGVAEDAVQYAGVKKDKVYRLPRFFERPLHTETIYSKGEMGEAFFLWPTNLQEHKNHRIALQALELYYAKGGTLKCYMTGVDTKNIMDKDAIKNPYVFAIHEMIVQSDALKKNIRIFGYVLPEKYDELIQKARFVFHPGYADNGNGAVVDAAFYHIPSCSSLYSAMEEIKNELDLPIKFFDYHDPVDIMHALFYMENNGDTLVERECTKLWEHVIDNTELCLTIYSQIKSGLNL